jgi:hypothetical protein
MRLANVRPEVQTSVPPGKKKSNWCMKKIKRNSTDLKKMWQDGDVAQW